MERKGAAESSSAMMWFWIVLGAILLIYLLFIFNGFGFISGFSNVNAKISDAQGFDEIYANQNYKFIGFIVGKVPTFLAELTSVDSAAIIVIGIWLMLFLTFGDIISVFGMFTKPISWAIGLLLSIIAANLKVVMIISVLSLTLTAGLGVLSVVASLVMVFVVFLGVNFGIQPLRKLAFKRKKDEMKLRAAMGSAKAAAGLKTLKDIEGVAVEDE